MLTPASEHIDDALARLSPDERALLELSYRRGIANSEIAGVLHVPPDEVERRRVRILDHLAEHVDTGSRAELLALLVESWVDEPATNGAPAPPSVNGGPAPAAPAKAPRRKFNPVLLAGLIAAAVIAAIALATSLGDGGDKTSHPAAPVRPAPHPGGAPLALRPIVGTTGPARGSAQVQGGRLQLRADGLRPGRYTAWLYNSVADAVPLGDLREGSLDAKLPPGAARYGFVDVSREPADGNPNHSGASVLRAPLGRLSR